MLDETSATSLDHDFVMNENEFYISTKELFFSFFENVNGDTRLKTVVTLLKTENEKLDFSVNIPNFFL